MDDELYFSYSNNESKPNKSELLKIYKRRGTVSERWKQEHPFVVGFDRLLPDLEETTIDTINISSIFTNTGAYIVFSDMDYISFIGILKSKRSLLDLKEKEITMNFILENEKIKKQP